MKANQALQINIEKAILHLCSNENDIISKTLRTIRRVQTKTVEPGVEMVDSLERIIKESLREAKKQGCDYRIIIKGIIIGAFRSSEVVRDEAHKTIDHIVRHILTNVINIDIDLDISIRALIEGIITIAQEKKLNIEEAVSEAGTSIILAIRSIKGDLEDQARRVLSQPIQGFIVELKEHSLESR